MRLLPRLVHHLSLHSHFVSEEISMLRKRRAGSLVQALCVRGRRSVEKKGASEAAHGGGGGADVLTREPCVPAARGRRSSS